MVRAVCVPRGPLILSTVVSALWMTPGRLEAQAFEAEPPVRWWEQPQAPPESSWRGRGLPQGGATESTRSSEVPSESPDGSDDQSAERPQLAARPDAPPQEPKSVIPTEEVDPLSEEAIGLGVPDIQPRWKWQQVLASPRIGGQLRSIAVDPLNPNRIFVGTRENTILRSMDGGATWRELELSPSVTERNSVNIQIPGLPRLGEPTTPAFEVLLLPPFREPLKTVPSLIGFHSNPFGFPATDPSVRPSTGIGNLGRNAFATSGMAGTPRVGAIPEFGITVLRLFRGLPLADMLRNATRPRPFTEVKRILFCPSAVFPIIVASSIEVLGSIDDGLTWVRLVRFPANININQVACSKGFPAHVLVSSNFGLYRSTDGGVTFDQDLSGWPGRPSGACSFGANGDERTVFASVDHILYRGDPESETGLEYVYPDFNNSATAPWERINWIDVDGDSVWMATNDGVRISRDGGRSFENLARTLLERQVIDQVIVGTNEIGEKRTAILIRECMNPRAGVPCRRSRVYASDDDGVTWYRLFDDVTRRTPFQIAASPAVKGIPPRWWVLTGGELWATVPNTTQQVPPVDRKAQQWALARLQKTPPLFPLIENALKVNDFRPQDMEASFAALRERNYFPEIYVEADILFQQTDSAWTTRIFEPRQRDYVVGTVPFYLFFWLQWTLRDTQIVTEQLAPVRNELLDLHNNIKWLVEDAWRERLIHLQRLAQGINDPLVVATLRQRIDGLEVILETILRAPLESAAQLELDT